MFDQPLMANRIRFAPGTPLADLCVPLAATLNEMGDYDVTPRALRTSGSATDAVNRLHAAWNHRLSADTETLLLHAWADYADQAVHCALRIRASDQEGGVIDMAQYVSGPDEARLRATAQQQELSRPLWLASLAGGMEEAGVLLLLPQLMTLSKGPPPFIMGNHEEQGYALVLWNPLQGQAVRNLMTAVSFFGVGALLTYPVENEVPPERLRGRGPKQAPGPGCVHFLAPHATEREVVPFPPDILHAMQDVCVDSFSAMQECLFQVPEVASWVARLTHPAYPLIRREIGVLPDGLG